MRYHLHGYAHKYVRVLLCVPSVGATYDGGGGGTSVFTTHTRARPKEERVCWYIHRFVHICLNTMCAKDRSVSVGCVFAVRLNEMASRCAPVALSD